MKACERYLNAINELVDGTLGPLRRAELDLHLETCDGCRALLADLQRIADTAGSLDQLEPSPRVWTGIADQLAKEGRVAGAPARGSYRNYTVLALAAALVIAIGASLLMLASRDRGTPATTTTAQQTAPADQHPPADGNVDPDDPVQGMTSELALTEQHFRNAIEQFSKTADGVDPQTKARIQENLLDINQAIAETQAVIQKDPQSVQARQSLYQMLKQKIQFLQDTLALMNAMRLGDAAGAAQIVEGKS